MCIVIAVVHNDKRPTKKLLTDAELANPDGGGIGWLAPNGQARWRKGLSAAQMWRLMKRENICAPFIAHFRIATAGGKTEELCHPFPVTVQASVAKQGEVCAPLLFHNGHWSDWRRYALEAAIQRGVGRFPGGDWSDSRAMAWLAANAGLPILQLMDEKIAVLDPQRRTVLFYGTGWTEHEGMWVSNTSFTRFENVHTAPAGSAINIPINGASGPPTHMKSFTSGGRLEKAVLHGVEIRPVSLIRTVAYNSTYFTECRLCTVRATYELINNNPSAIIMRYADLCDDCCALFVAMSDTALGRFAWAVLAKIRARIPWPNRTGDDGHRNSTDGPEAMKIALQRMKELSLQLQTKRGRKKLPPDLLAELCAEAQAAPASEQKLLPAPLSTPAQQAPATNVATPLPAVTNDTLPSECGE